MKKTPKEAAQAWSVTVKRVYQMIDSGEAKARRDSYSGRLYFTEAEVLRVAGIDRPKGRPRKDRKK